MNLPKPGIRFVDQWGVVWEYRPKDGIPMVWNEQLGYGVWNNGKGLQ